MDDGMLSQDEIDALLNMTNENDDKQEDNEEATTEMYLTPLEIDTIGEIGNISLGSSATTLSTLLNQKVDITTPSVSIVKKTGIKEVFPYEHVSLQVDYQDGFDGENIFLMKAQDAAIISDIMLGGKGKDPKEKLTEIELSAVQEAMNQMMGSSATSMSTVFNKRVDISPPLVEYEDIDKLEEVEGEVEGEVFVKVSFQLKVGELIDSSIMQLIPLDFAKELVDQLVNPSSEEADDDIELEQPPIEKGQEANQQSKQQPIQEEPHIQQTAKQQPSATQHIGSNMPEEPNIQTAAFSEFDPVELSEQNQRNLDMLLDIPLKVTVELGRTQQTVAEVLNLSPGSIVELDKLAGEPVDVLVNNKLIAKGEVVVIDENFGVRVTDIVSQKDRLMQLK